MPGLTQEPAPLLEVPQWKSGLGLELELELELGLKLKQESELLKLKLEQPSTFH